MNDKTFQHFKDMNNNEFQNNLNSGKPYYAKNMIARKAEISDANKVDNKNIQKSENAPAEDVQANEDIGYIAIGVFTALQALPVQGANITIYDMTKDGEENVLYNLVTDENGRVPNVSLPVSHDPDSSTGSQKYFFAKYNMRVEAINYYTVNVLDMRVFPNITTLYRVDLIPVMSGGKSSDRPDQTIVIPPSPLDESNK